MDIIRRGLQKYFIQVLVISAGILKAERRNCMASKMEFVSGIVKGHFPDGGVGFSTGLKSWSPLKHKTMRGGFLTLIGISAGIGLGVGCLSGAYIEKKKKAKTSEADCPSQQVDNEIVPTTITSSNQET